MPVAIRVAVFTPNPFAIQKLIADSLWKNVQTNPPASLPSKKATASRAQQVKIHENSHTLKIFDTAAPPFSDVNSHAHIKIARNRNKLKAHLLIIVIKSVVISLNQRTIAIFEPSPSHINIHKIVDNEELKKLNKELEEAKIKLENLNHFKSHLLSLASHQVRAPLAAIKGYAAVLREGLYGEVNEKIRETLEKIEFEADDLINLVTNIMDIRKVEEGKMDYEFSRVNLRELAEETVENLHLLAINKKLDLSFSAPRKKIFVVGDEQKLKHVILNLVDNAIKYTPRGLIKAEVREDGESAIFSVKDSGLGISAGTSPLLFEEFVRDEKIKKEIRGTGIGLHIAKSIIEAHGGKIWCESEGEGKGSTFAFLLKRV